MNRSIHKGLNKQIELGNSHKNVSRKFMKRLRILGGFTVKGQVVIAFIVSTFTIKVNVKDRR